MELACIVVLLTFIIIAALTLYLRQRVGAAVVQPKGPNGLLLPARLSEKKRYAYLLETYGVRIGLVLGMGLCGLLSWVCGGLGSHWPANYY